MSGGFCLVGSVPATTNKQTNEQTEAGVNRRRTDHVDKVLVVRDDHQLEVLLPAPLRDEAGDGARQPALVVVVQVGRRLVQGHDAAVDAEGLGQREADDDGCQHAGKGGGGGGRGHVLG